MMNPEALNPETANAALSLGEKMAEALKIKTAFTVHLFGLVVPVTDTIIISWVAMALLTLFAWLATRRLQETPTGLQAIAEALVEFLNKFCKENMGHRGETYAPFVGTVALFLVVVNCLPILSPVAAFGFEPLFVITPPAKDINFAGAMGFTTIVIVLIAGIKTKGVGGWMKTLVQPAAFMLPFKLLEFVVRPVSLALRLFGNILGAFILMQLLENVMPVALPPIVGLYFDLFDGLIQAVVFTFLTTIYIAEAVE